MNQILLIDHRVGFAHALKMVLNQAGYEINAASTLEEAFITAGKKHFSLLIVGEMPQGLLRVCYNLRHHPATRDSRLLLHTADWSIHNEAFVRACEADGILPYPAEQTMLLQAIATCLDSCTV